MLDNALRFLSLADANVRFVLVGSLLIGGTSGMLGTFAVLRKRSLMGDALAHAALPGVALAFMLTGSKALPVLIAGAAATGVLGVLIIQLIVRHTRIKADAALGIVLSVFFGVGIVLLTHIQRSATGNQAGLDKFLFGQAASLVEDDLWVMSLLALGIGGAVLFLYKELKGLIFDAEFMEAAGYNVRRLDLILMALIVLTVMVGLQAVGVVLIVAMLITPAVAARFWTERLASMLILSTAFGAVAGASGTFLSALAPRIPTGPVMVLVATAFFTVSALLAPRRGLLAKWRRHCANARRERRQHFLRALVELEEGPGEGAEESQPKGRAVGAAFPPSAIAEGLGWEVREVEREGRRWERRRLLEREGDRYRLTPSGREEGIFVLKSHRLWEHYLVHREILAEDHVDRPADEVEHLLTREIIERLEDILEEEQALDRRQVATIHGPGSGYRRGGRE